eukprot:s1280_g6.t1
MRVSLLLHGHSSLSSPAAHCKYHFHLSHCDHIAMADFMESDDYGSPEREVGTMGDMPSDLIRFLEQWMSGHLEGPGKCVLIQDILRRADVLGRWGYTEGSIVKAVTEKGLRSRLYCDDQGRLWLRNETEQLRVVVEDVLKLQLIPTDMSIIDMMNQELVSHWLNVFGATLARERIDKIKEAVSTSEQVVLMGPRIAPKSFLQKVPNCNEGPIWIMYDQSTVGYGFSEDSGNDMPQMPYLDPQWQAAPMMWMKDEDSNSQMPESEWPEAPMVWMQVEDSNTQMPESEWQATPMMWMQDDDFNHQMPESEWQDTPMMWMQDDDFNQQMSESELQAMPMMCLLVNCGTMEQNVRGRLRPRRTRGQHLVDAAVEILNLKASDLAEDGTLPVATLIQESPWLKMRFRAAGDLARALSHFGETLTVDQHACTVRFSTFSERLVGLCEMLLRKQNGSVLTLAMAVNMPAMQSLFAQEQEKSDKDMEQESEQVQTLRLALEYAEILQLMPSDDGRDFDYVDWRSPAEILLGPVEMVLSGRSEASNVLEAEGEVSMALLMEDPTICRMLMRAGINSNQALAGLQSALQISHDFELDSAGLSCRRKGQEQGRSAPVQHEEEEAEASWGCQRRRHGFVPFEKDAVELRKLLQHYFQPFNLQHNRVFMMLLQGYGPTAAQAVEPGVPRKCINTPQDLELFTRSKLCNQLVSFVTELAEAAKGLPCDPARKSKASPLVMALSGILDEMEPDHSDHYGSLRKNMSWIEDFPPLHQPMRFGNKAFRSWHQRLCERSEGLLTQALGHAAPEHAKKAEPLAKELSYYLRGAFGDERRIDYGTGHEVAFLGVLFALGATGVLARADAADAVLIVFADYIRVMRKLQKVYVLEPAGSHGVWGLDDYHMLPFLFGAAQLIGKEEEVPTGEVYREKAEVDAIRQAKISNWPLIQGMSKPEPWAEKIARESESAFQRWKLLFCSLQSASFRGSHGQYATGSEWKPYFTIKDISLMPRINEVLNRYCYDGQKGLLAAAVDVEDEEMPVRVCFEAMGAKGMCAQRMLWLELPYTPIFRYFQTARRCKEVQVLLEPKIAIKQKVEALSPNAFLVMSYSISSDLSHCPSPKADELIEATASGDLDPNALFWETRLQKIKRQLLWHAADIICVQGIHSVGNKDRCSETNTRWFGSYNDPTVNHLTSLYREMAKKNYGVVFMPTLKQPGSSQIHCGNAVFWKRTRWQMERYWDAGNGALCVELISKLQGPDLLVCCSRAGNVYAEEWGKSVSNEELISELFPAQRALLHHCGERSLRPIWCADFGTDSDVALTELAKGSHLQQVTSQKWFSSTNSILGYDPWTSSARSTAGQATDLILHDEGLQPIAVLNGLPMECHGKSTFLELLQSGYPSDHLIQMAAFMDSSQRPSQLENSHAEASYARPPLRQHNAVDSEAPHGKMPRVHRKGWRSWEDGC